MHKAVIYIHGKGGTSSESEHYKALFKDADVIGFDYQSQTPWEAKVEFSDFFNAVSAKYQSVYIVANSIGAFFTMNALADRNIEKAFFISPIVNMEKLIADMMIWANVTEQDLYKEKEIETSFGETLSWEYLCYVREHPVVWNIPTKILYGDKDNLTSFVDHVLKFFDCHGFQRIAGRYLPVLTPIIFFDIELISDHFLTVITDSAVRDY